MSALDHEWMRQPKQVLVRKKLSVVTLQKSIRAKKQEHSPGKKVAAFTANTADKTNNADRMQNLHDAFNSYMTRQDDDTATVFTAPTVEKPRPVQDSAKGFPFKHYYKLGDTVRLSRTSLL